MQDAALGQPVHYICTESHKCQAAFVSDVGDGTTVMLHVFRPADQPDNPDQAPVERMKDIGYMPAVKHEPGTWHWPDEHSGATV